MALEALCGETRRPVRSENRFLFGEEEEALDEGAQEYITSFPNAVDPMKILAPPFVSFYRENTRSLLKWDAITPLKFCKVCHTRIDKSCRL